MIFFINSIFIDNEYFYRNKIEVVLIIKKKKTTRSEMKAKDKGAAYIQGFNRPGCSVKTPKISILRSINSLPLCNHHEQRTCPLLRFRQKSQRQIFPLPLRLCFLCFHFSFLLFVLLLQIYSPRTSPPIRRLQFLLPPALDWFVLLSRLLFTFLKFIVS